MERILKLSNGNSTCQHSTGHTEQSCIWQCPKPQNHMSDKPLGLKKGNFMEPHSSSVILHTRPSEGGALKTNPYKGCPIWIAEGVRTTSGAGRATCNLSNSRYLADAPAHLAAAGNSSWLSDCCLDMLLSTKIAPHRKCVCTSNIQQVKG